MELNLTRLCGTSADRIGTTAVQIGATARMKQFLKVIRSEAKIATAVRTVLIVRVAIRRSVQQIINYCSTVLQRCLGPSP